MANKNEKCKMCGKRHNPSGNKWCQYSEIEQKGFKNDPHKKKVQGLQGFYVGILNSAKPLQGLFNRKGKAKATKKKKANKSNRKAK